MAQKIGLRQYDVVVVGGGAAGIAAAVSSAQSGAKTLGIESGPTVGGDLLSGLPIDIHNTRGEVRLTKIPPYGIPYRCLTPKGLDNVLVAGRNFSATHKALGTVRVMATCMAMGQAAAWSVREECSVHAVDVTDLQARLRANGAYLLDDQRDADAPAHFKIEETIQ